MKTMDWIIGLTCLAASLVAIPFLLALETLARIIGPFSISGVHFGKPPSSCPECGGSLKLHGYGEYSGHKLTCYHCNKYELDGVESYGN